MERRGSSSSETISEEILAKVASTKDVDTLDLDPLYDAVDPDAICALVERGFDGKLEFKYAGCTVSVDGDGQVEAELDRRSSDRFRIR